MYYPSLVTFCLVSLLFALTNATFFPRGDESKEVLLSIISQVALIIIYRNLIGKSRGIQTKTDYHHLPSVNTLELHAGENCLRPCTGVADSKICYFKFVLEYYHVMGSACGGCATGNHLDCLHPQCVTADGHERGFMTINRQFPGPKIEVCENDTIVVDLENLMAGTSSSIHWHGILQEGTQYMDGVALVTQCPIPFFTTFRYRFKANHAGTHHYHSHAGHHKSNGIAGPLIIRAARNEEPQSNLYDYDLSEHTIFLNDWLHSYAEMFVPGLPNTLLLPKSVLINGRARYNPVL